MTYPLIVFALMLSIGFTFAIAAGISDWLEERL